jgi:hypothetical protein
MAPDAHRMVQSSLGLDYRRVGAKHVNYRGVVSYGIRPKASKQLINVASKIGTLSGKLSGKFQFHMLAETCREKILEPPLLVARA